MEIRLQQALVAAREGHFDTAQLLLVEAIRQNPEEANVWFLLAHLVDSPERQALYLENALLIDPEHVMAKEHLARLYSADVPPPIIKGGGELVSNPSLATPAPTTDSKFVPLAPARVSASPPVAEQPTPTLSSSTSSRSTPSTTSKSVDADWRRLAGSPKRASPKVKVSATAAQPRPATPAVQAQPPAAATPSTSSKPQPVNKWLLAVLVVLVAIAAFVVSYLAYSIFFT